MKSRFALGAFCALALAPLAWAADAPNIAAPLPPAPPANAPLVNAPPLANAPVLSAPAPAEHPAAPVVADCDAPAKVKVNTSWLSAEYLYWWVRDGNLPFPVATTSPAASLGILDLQNTRVLRGNETFDYRGFNGTRVTVGSWINDCTALGYELSGFFLEQRQDGFSVVSAANGTPLIARPFSDTTTGRGNSRLLAFPGGSSGRLDVASSSRLWGAEANALSRVVDGCALQVDALVGVRYLDLEEDLEFRDRTILFNNTTTTAFNGRGILAPASTSAFDKIATRNQFYGGQIGARIHYVLGDLGIDLTGKVAAGINHQTLMRDGSTTLIAGGGAVAPATVPGGFYVLSSNAGRVTSDRFGILPEIGVKVSYRLTKSVGLTAGYTYLWLNSVGRPGDQIDRTINPTLLPTSPTFGQPFGPQRPSAPFDRSSFDAHGVSVGLNVAF